MQEKVHKTMTITGVISIVVGIISIVLGVSTGVLMIVGGTRLMSDRKKLLF